MDFQNIPFANTNKDERNHTCTGLWSRYGKPVFAPDWFLDQLPTDHALDGELYAGRGGWQQAASYVKKHKPVDEEWRQIGLYVFDIPSWVRLFETGRINNPNFAEKEISINEITSLLKIDIGDRWYAPKRYEQNWNYLKATYDVVAPGTLKGSWGILSQEQLPVNRFKAEALLEDELKRIVRLGGEGIMLRRPHSLWMPRRTDEILKVKPENDHEGTIIGYTYGVGKLYGMVGSLRMRAKFGEAAPVDFDLSGFTDLERTLIPEYKNEACLNPGSYVTGKSVSERFPLGATVTFKYRELTDDGKPKEARYYRDRPAGV
jgi:DNA ligase-1